MNILFLTTLLPFPLDNGGKIKTYNTLKALSRNHNIDLICFSNNREDQKNISSLKNICRSVTTVNKSLVRAESKSNFFKDYIMSLFSSFPYPIYKFKSNLYKSELRGLRDTKGYDLIFIDHLPMMLYADCFTQPVVLDQHNVEYLILNRLLKEIQNPIKKILLKIETVKLKSFERKMLTKANKIIALSQQDFKSFKSLEPNCASKIKIIPISVENNGFVKRNKYSEQNKLKILFLGTMSWHPNSHGITWFVENVFKKLKETQFELNIVGKNPSNTIKKYNQLENVNVTGYVKDVNEYIEKSDICVVPIFYGSGLRVKILEAFSKKLPVVSTSIGAEGIKYKNEKDILIANNEMEFTQVLRDLQTNKTKLISLAENGYENYYMNYSLQALEFSLEQVLL